MAKAKASSDWAVILVMVLLLLATNLYWMLATRDMEERLDNQATAILKLQACYNDGTTPCE